MADQSLSYIDQLKQRIEAKVAWGSSAQWTHQDFDQLSERIWEETQTKLSATTLKRLWGKVNYQSKPATNTLNALARFVGYEHWRDFVGQQEVPLTSAPAATSDAKPSYRTSRWVGRRHAGRYHAGRRLALAISVPLLVLAALFFNRWISRTETVDGSAVTFTSDPVTRGLPNTVVFRYDASSLSSDSIAIQQSWDARLRTSVAKERDTYTATYYYPGYFRAKLLADGQVVKEHDLYVESDGWMAIAEREPVPYYLSSDTSAGPLRVSPEQLHQRKLLTRHEVPWISYYYVHPFGDVSANDFTLETRIKNDFIQGEAVCQTSYVNIICSRGHFSLPLSIPGCVGQLTMVLGKERLSGTTHDLSALGTDLSTWQTLRCEVKDRQVTLLLNGEVAYRGVFSDDIGKVVGLRYRFHGPGAVDYVRLWDQAGSRVYDEAFDQRAT